MRGGRLRRSHGGIAGATRDAFSSDSEDPGWPQAGHGRVLDEEKGRKRKHRRIGPLRITSGDEAMDDE